MRLKIYTFEQDLKKRLKNPEFRKAWEDMEPEYLLSKQLVGSRIARKMSQRELARKVKTSQAAISRVEAMNANPSLNFLKRLARALDTKITLQIG